MSTVESATTTEHLDERGSAVRFETQCIVIPDPAHRSRRRPRVVTKSYALPLWKRRTSSASSSPSAPPENASFEENHSHLVLRVPLPTFSLKPPHPTNRSADRAPLPPCLVHRPHPTEPSSLSNRHARTPQSRKPSLSPPRPDIVTVPLRPCCAACQSVTEAALVEGNAWPEHFSRAASRQRSLSVDDSPRTITVAGSAASASYGTLGVSINVDEIDKRRRSSDTGPSSTSQETLWSDNTEDREKCSVPSILYHTASFNSSATDTRSPPSPSRITPATPRIPEEDDDEDENELFPLPSPKRTPTTSPAPSLAGSLSSLLVAQPNPSSGPSPTPSTCSGDSAVLPPHKRQFLAPPPCASSSSLSLPKLSEPTTDLSLTEDLPRAPSPSLLSTLPSLSGRHRSRSPSPCSSLIPPTLTDTLPSAPHSSGTRTGSEVQGASSEVHVPTTPVPIPSSHVLAQPSISPRHSPAQTRLPWRSKRSVSADIDVTPPTPPTPAPSTPFDTKKSFSMSSPLQIFADVLRGVGAMGSGSASIAPGV